MKIVARPVEAVAVFYRGEYPEPRKIRYEDRDGVRKTISVDKILESEPLRFGSVEFIFMLQSVTANIGCEMLQGRKIRKIRSPFRGRNLLD